MEEKNQISWPGWDIGACIGKGGFGAVYEIRREVFGDVERCALKVITIPKDAGEIEYMRCEGMDDESITTTLHNQVGDIIGEYKMMSKMRDNPNIVHCDDFRYTRHQDDLGWDIYIKMELLTPLLKALDRVQTEAQIIRLGRDMCSALMACQEVNIIHRDIKPQNIFLSPKGHFKLGDFGIARTLEHTTKATAGIGTYSFMAPEVALGKSYGSTVDIYSLGLVLYWLLNERRSPFVPLPPAASTVAVNEEARVRRYSGEQIPPPKYGSRELKAVVLKACAYNPEERYQTAREMLDALNGLRGEKPAAEKPKRDPEPEPEEEETVLSGGERNRPAKARPAVPDRPAPRKQVDTGEETVVSAKHTDVRQYPAKEKETPEPSKSKDKPRGNFKWGILACVAILLLLLCVIIGSKTGTGPAKAEENQLSAEETTASETEPVSTTLPATPSWEKNILMSDPLEEENSSYDTMGSNTVLGSVYQRNQISSITFLDTLQDMPVGAWDVSAGKNGTVQAWVKRTGDSLDLFIAAEGGIQAPETCDGLFAGYKNVKNISMSNSFHTENTVTMANMFRSCENLEAVDISGLDTANVTDMSNMFYGCYVLTELDVAGFDTANVTNMHGMFSYCFDLTLLDLSGFDTSRVTDMSNMFEGCHALRSLDLSSFDTSNVTTLAGMFDTCTHLEAVQIESFDTSKVTDMSWLFFRCEALTELDLSGWDTAQVTSMWSMFANCDGLTTLNLSGWNTSNVTKMAQMFWHCDFTELDLSHFDTAKVEDFGSMFLHCDKLTSLNISSFRTGSATSIGHMFADCAALSSLDLHHFDTANVKNMAGMFSGCSNLAELDVSSFDTANVNDMSKMFENCSSLTELDLSSFRTSKVKNMSGMFEGCESLTDLDISGFDVSNVEVYGSFMDKEKTVNGRPWEEIFQ